MGSFSHWPFQQAVYQALTGDASLMALVSNVYDRVPENAVFPYVTIGDAVGRDWSTTTSAGMEYRLALQLFSRGGGRKQAAGIMERLYAVLHDATLTVTGQTLVLLRYESSAIRLEDDGVTHRGVFVLRALIESD